MDNMKKTLLQLLVLEKLKKYPTVSKILEIEGTVLAGGAVRDLITGDEPKDFDIFFINDKARINVESEFFTDNSEIASTNYTTTYEVDETLNPEDFIPDVVTQTIQLIHKQTYENEQAVIKDFDFTVTQFAISKNGIFFGENSISDLDKKVVKVNVITKPLDSLNRLVKYAQKEYEYEETYQYILDVMKTQPSGIILGASFYEEIE